MQTSILRPRFLDFEDKGGILPAHIVGLLGTGKFKTATGKLTYDVYAGNGPKIVMGGGQSAGVLDINQAGDNNHQAMLGFNVGYEFPGALDGLKLAVHGLKGDVDDDSDGTYAGTTRNNKTGVNLLGGSAMYLARDWEALGEYYHFDNRDKSGITGAHRSWAAYVQVGKNFNGWTPYVRFEHAVLSRRDNFFAMQASGQSYSRQSLGVRYDLEQNAALKLELLGSKFAEDVTGGGAKSFNSIYAQYAIGF
jgi:hypothetical protein